VRLIYNDPSRHFGGNLDDVGHRLRHYLDVLTREVERLAVNPLPPPVQREAEQSCCCCE
jgi:hypothetical protein